MKLQSFSFESLTADVGTEARLLHISVLVDGTDEALATLKMMSSLPELYATLNTVASQPEKRAEPVEAPEEQPPLTAPPRKGAKELAGAEREPVIDDKPAYEAPPEPAPEPAKEEPKAAPEPAPAPPADEPTPTDDFEDEPPFTVSDEPPAEALDAIANVSKPAEILPILFKYVDPSGDIIAQMINLIEEWAPKSTNLTKVKNAKRMSYQDRVQAWVSANVK